MPAANSLKELDELLDKRYNDQTNSILLSTTYDTRIICYWLYMIAKSIVVLGLSRGIK